MENFTDWSFNKWADLLEDKIHGIDKESFLLASVLPIADLCPLDGKYLVVVSIADLEQYTPKATDGLSVLVKGGYAKWEKNGKEVWGVSVGDSPDGIQVKLYGTAAKKSERKRSGIALSKAAQEGLSANLKESCPRTIEVLDELMTKYRSFCDKMKIKNTPDKVYDMVKNYIDAAEEGRVNSDVLLNYLSAVNAMVFDELKLTHTKTPKYRTVANKVLARATPKELFEIVPDFVLHYPEMAKGNFTETNIFNLSFNIVTFKRRAGKQKRIAKKYDDNDTL